MWSDPDAAFPTVFGRYILLRRLCRGGMGDLFVARAGGEAGFERVCVIKTILSDLSADRAFVRRFVDEMRVAIRLDHANIARVYEAGMVEGDYFLALEYIEGRDLRRVLALLRERGARVPAELALWIAREVSSGLSYAHRRTDAEGRPLGVVHCDVSPPNVMISFEGEVKLIDFGVARSAVCRTTTNPDVGFGKIGYMAPEQLLRGGKVDPRTDVYATGVLLYELLSGEKLFTFPKNIDYRDMARMVSTGEHPRLSERDPTLQRFEPLVSRALAPAPEDRFPDAASLRDALQVALARENPTLTASALGARVRSLFAEEVEAERALAAEASAVDLTAFADELTGAMTKTVSFAHRDDDTVGVPRQSAIQPPAAPPPPGVRWWIVAAVAAAAFAAGLALGLLL